MKKDSSNIEMEEIFSILSEIKSVEPAENMFPKVLEKIQEKNKISKSWIFASASVMLLLISIEYQWINANDNTSKYAVIIPKTNNTFYNE